MNEITPGKNTSEFKLTAATNIINAIIALLIAYGVLTTETVPLWQSLIMAVMVAGIPIATTLMNKEYTKGRTALKLDAAWLAAPNTVKPVDDWQPGAARTRPEAAE